MQISPSSMAAAQRVFGDSHQPADPSLSTGLLADTAYTDPDFFEFEREAIFKREWLYAGHVSEVPAAGKVLPRTVLGEPLMLVHDMSDEIRVMSALCQHRHFPLIGGRDAPQPDRAVTRRNIVCPHHSWTYSLDGRLIAAPHIDPSAPPSGRRTLVLPQCKVEIADGFVFINFDPTAQPLRPTLTNFTGVLEQHESAGLTATRPVRRANLPVNWKDYIAAFLEARHDGEVLAIPPNSLAVASPTSVLVESVNPMSASSTDVESTILYPTSTTERPDFDKIYETDLVGLRSLHAQLEAAQVSDGVPSARTVAPADSAPAQFSSWHSQRCRAALPEETVTS